MKPLIKIKDGNDFTDLTYQCQQEWPDDAVVTLHWRLPTGLECFKFETDDPEEEPKFDRSPRCAGMVHLPVPAHIPAANNWYEGRVNRGRFNTLGGDVDSWEKTEKMLWDHLQTILNCDHNFRNTCWNLNGDGSCGKCHMFVHGMYMDKWLQECRLLAYQAHDGQKRKYNGWPYITHPQSVYERINWWRKDLPMEQWLRMAKAAWLHDVLEDCPHVKHEAVQIVAGEEAYNLVVELTNPSKKHPELRRKERKKMDREHLKSVSWDAKIIKFFDRVENLRDLEKCEDKDFLALYAHESQQMFDEVFGPLFVQMSVGGYAHTHYMEKEYLSWVRAAERRSK